MAGAEHLRLLAERMLALAMKTPDPQLAELLATRATDYFDHTGALEKALQHAAQPDDAVKKDDPGEEVRR
jgi:hypothetical protein